MEKQMNDLYPKNMQDETRTSLFERNVEKQKQFE